MARDWDTFRRHFHHWDGLGLSLDLGALDLAPDAVAAGTPALSRALAEMAALEAGAIANADEGRMVGHYWLRAPALAPSPELARAIERSHAELEAFVAKVHAGTLTGARGTPFSDALVIGIGGSALGAQFLARALGRGRHDRLALHFLDNTDPDGIEDILDRLAGRLDCTLCLVVSKSGGTKEIWNALALTEAAFAAAGLALPPQAIAVTLPGSRLDHHAESSRFLARFPLWDWVGGRTSALSAAGLLPSALQGADPAQLLAGAAAMDAATRQAEPAANPAALLALAWHAMAEGRDRRAMVVLPYKDRLELLGRYLQQLVMESLGKARDRAGRPVAQGLTVFGNKGTTDQHAYVQQLRDGQDDFFVSFIEVLRDTDRPQPVVEPGATAGDYLQAFLIGTRQALHERGRPSLTITLADIGARRLGGLIALFERTVGLYAALIDVNAYDQPGVEAGKIAGAAVLALQADILALLRRHQGPALTAGEIAAASGHADALPTMFQVLRHLAANPEHGVSCTLADGEPLTAARYRLES